MEFISGRNPTKQWKQFLQANDKLYNGVELPTKNIRSSTKKKDVLAGEYRKSPVFAGSHIFAPAGYIERYTKDAVFRFHETKKDDLIMATTNLFEKIINIHPFEDGN